MMNVVVPSICAERYAGARIVAFSTGNVYPLTPVKNGGARETSDTAPIGEYAQSCVGRERVFEHYAAAARGTGENDSGRITILVSHRFSTVRMADLIIVLDGARLVEVGTHDELMARSGQYSELYGIQAAAYR